ncbi:DUF2269 family protein [Streptomyces sp. NPDC001212]|uniref:DUF2269 family protein n=1 Tax=Streptomyces sp. CoT10 TaxID=2875762 RepID=UPI001CD5AE58|nr:DUF2269 family protein [Streptomyces sp. CoT10]
MTKFLLAVHVLAAIIAIGPVTVAASMFPPAARRALASPEDPRAVETVLLLLRICRVYAVVGVAVPVFGFATAKNMGVLGDTWLIVSIVLTALAAVVLVALVLPRQTAMAEALEERRVAEGTDGTDGGDGGAATTTTTVTAPTAAAPTLSPRATVRLAMFTGQFNLLWAAVTVLMIVRPGSTTGA